MKKIAFSIMALALVLATVITTVPAQAAEENEIEASIQDGITWLVDQQDPIDGSWGDSCYRVAQTGFAVVKLEDRAFELGFDSPFDPNYEYSDNVTAGLDFILSNAYNGTCGLTFEDCGQETYETGIAMMAIAASRDMDRVVNVVNPLVDGMTYEDVLQATVDYFANSQTLLGGWFYECAIGMDWADQSNSGYAVLGLRYAEAAGIAIPQTLKDNLSDWIDFIQNDPGPADDGYYGDPDGGSGYSWPDEWVNLLKTGNLLFEMAFVGDTTETQRVIDAIDYIERHWNDANWDPGWKGPGYGGEDRPNMQAAYCLMKGFESFGIDTITVNGSDKDWFDEMSTAIVDSQEVGDYWLWDYWGDEILATEWALLTLELVAPCFIEVACVETVNPQGNNVPGKNRSDNAKSKAQNPDGFYELTATSTCDPEPQIWVVDTGSGMEFGPFASGTKIKYTEAPGGTPSMKKIGSANGQGGAIAWHITGNGDACVYAVDAAGTQAECVDCLVPPPPK